MSGTYAVPITTQVRSLVIMGSVIAALIFVVVLTFRRGWPVPALLGPAFMLALVVITLVKIWRRDERYAAKVEWNSAQIILYPRRGEPVSDPGSQAW